MNFWTIARDQGEELQARLRDLPYSRRLYYDYHRRLWARGAETVTDLLERATLWFYVQRSGFAGVGAASRVATGWGYAKHKEAEPLPRRFHSAVDLLAHVRKRFRLVQIDDRDFGRIIEVYEQPRALFYCDPPYIGAESYYQDATGPFTRADHTRLATLLNATPALVALSYYDHPEVDLLYPPVRWRKMRWSGYKTAKRGDGTARLRSNEVLIMNYPEVTGGIWARPRATHSETEDDEEDINLWTI